MVCKTKFKWGDGVNIKNNLSQSEDIGTAFSYAMQKQYENTRISDVGVILKVNEGDDTTYDIQPINAELYATSTDLKQTELPIYKNVWAVINKGVSDKYNEGDICLFVYTDNPYTTDKSRTYNKQITYNNKVFTIPFVTAKRGQKHQLSNCVIVGRIGKLNKDNIKNV